MMFVKKNRDRVTSLAVSDCATSVVTSYFDLYNVIGIQGFRDVILLLRYTSSNQFWCDINVKQ